MESIKAATLVLVLGASTLGALGEPSTAKHVADAQASRVVALQNAGRRTEAVSGVHVGVATTRQVNELLRLYSLPVVLNTNTHFGVTGAPAHSVGGGFAVCYDGLDGLLIESPLAGN